MGVATYGAETVQTTTEEHLRSDYVDCSAVGDVDVGYCQSWLVAPTSLDE